MHLFGEDKLKGVAYYRFSAEDKQENSIENQREALEKVAAAADVQIVDAFEDDGVTGLVFERPGFQAMLNKYVYALNAPRIDYILFYDASRIGRVQRMSRVWRLIGELEDKDIRLGSVDRGIPKGETTVVDTIMLTLDFAMASDYSRLLSNKVFLGSVKVSEQGYSAGGRPPYGYDRVLLDEQRQHKQILEPGVRKEVSNQRVSFVPSEDGTAEVVTRIFYEFVSCNFFPQDIAERLNADHIFTAQCRKWNAASVTRILTNETYVGTRIYNKTWGKLHEKKRKNPEREWVRCLNAHPPLVDSAVFYQAQDRLYWLRPRRNGVIRQIKSAERYVWHFIDETIGNFNADQQFYIRRHMPVLFGSTYVLDGEERSCFYVPPVFQRYGFVLFCAVSTAPEDGGGLRALYKLPVGSLANRSYLITHTRADHEAINTPEALRSDIQELADKVLERHVPWLSRMAH